MDRNIINGILDLLFGEKKTEVEYKTIEKLAKKVANHEYVC